MAEKPICKTCSVRFREAYFDKKKNKLYYHSRCSSCRKIDKPSYYAKYKKNYCESCNFIAINSIQLDVDHIDGNHKNNDPSNLRTLCANCHRLKTFLNNQFNWQKPQSFNYKGKQLCTNE